MRTTSIILMEKEPVETKIVTISTLNIVTTISPIITSIINHPQEITNLPYQEKIQNRTNQYQKYQSTVVTQINIKITHIILEVVGWSRISSQLIYKLLLLLFWSYVNVISSINFAFRKWKQLLIKVILMSCYISIIFLAYHFPWN